MISAPLGFIVVLSLLFFGVFLIGQSERRSFQNRRDVKAQIALARHLKIEIPSNFDKTRNSEPLKNEFAPKIQQSFSHEWAHYIAMVNLKERGVLLQSTGTSDEASEVEAEIMETFHQPKRSSRSPTKQTQQISNFARTGSTTRRRKRSVRLSN